VIDLEEANQCKTPKQSIASLIIIPYQGTVWVIQSVIQCLRLQHFEEGCMVKFTRVSRNELLHPMFPCPVSIWKITEVSKFNYNC